MSDERWARNVQMVFRGVNIVSISEEDTVGK